MTAATAHDAEAVAEATGAPAADRWIIRAVLFGSIVNAGVFLAVFVASNDFSAAGAFGDFFAFWSFAKLAVGGHADRLYDMAALADFQRSLGLGAASYPDPYPPVFLLLIWPLGLLPLFSAWALWLGASFAAYVAAGIGGNSRLRALALATAPASLVTSSFGQNGFLTAALLIGGLRLIATRPVVAGVLLGFLCYKPTLAALVPFALVAAGRWRVLAAAATTACALVALSAAFFGPAIWQSWLEFLPHFSRLFEQERPALGHYMMTVTANLYGYGVDPTVAAVVQAAVSAAVVVGVFFLFRRAQGALAIAGLAVGALLVTPYALVYDMPAIAIAVILLVEENIATGYSYAPGERLALLGAWFLPVLLVPKLAFPLPGSLILAALFAFILRRGSAAALIRRRLNRRKDR